MNVCDTSGGAVTADTNCCTNCVETSPHLDLPVFLRYKVVVVDPPLLRVAVEGSDNPIS